MENREKYMLTFCEVEEEHYFLSLTKSQIAILKWLNDEGKLNVYIDKADDIEFDTIE